MLHSDVLRYIVRIKEVGNVDKQEKKSSLSWGKVTLVIACFALLLAAFFLIHSNLKNAGGSTSVIPYVKINDKIYIIDPNYPNTSKNVLSDSFVPIGMIEGNSSSNKAQDLNNGDSNGCKVGEKIFQSPNSLNEIYVYTTLFSGSNEYRYVRFIFKER